MTDLKYDDSCLLALNRILINNTSGSIINNYFGLGTGCWSYVLSLILHTYMRFMSSKPDI